MQCKLSFTSPIVTSDDNAGRNKVLKLGTHTEKVRVNAKEAKSSIQRKTRNKQIKKSRKNHGVPLQALNWRS